MLKQSTFFGGLARERPYFRQEPNNLHENFVEAYHFLNQKKMKQRNNLQKS